MPIYGRSGRELHFRQRFRFDFAPHCTEFSVMKVAGAKQNLSVEKRDVLLGVLKERFEKNSRFHVGITWAKVKSRLKSHPEKLWSLSEMERTGGEPDVVGQDKVTGELHFVDCSTQSPTDRCSLCYDRTALDGRKKFPPKGCITEMAEGMGVELLTEAQYQELQMLGEFDTKSSSWLLTPAAVRELGGAIFGDRRFGRVFIYHNGAESYYEGRGFRALLRV